MLKLDDLNIFLAVVDQGSFTKAADFCQLPKSTVSRHIRELEDCLGVRLLERNTRRLTLTEPGLQLASRAHHVLDEVEQLEKEVGHESEPQGTIHVYTPTILTAVCADKVAEFCQEYPHIQIDVRSTASGQNLGIDTRFDVILYVGKPPDSSLIARFLTDITFDYYASPVYAEHHGLPESTDDLDQHTIIYRPIYDDGRDSWRLGEQVVPIKPRIRVDSPYLSHALILQGIGLGCIPKLMIGKELKDNRLIQLFDGRFEFKEPLYAVYPSRRYVPLAVKVLLDYFLATFPERIPLLESGEFEMDNLGQP
jgi:DNA-binding transcriptional LysR family regulator